MDSAIPRRLLPLPAGRRTKYLTLLFWLVLLDTFLTRSLLIPALAVHIGRRFWWPGRIRPAVAEAPPAPALVGSES